MTANVSPYGSVLYIRFVGGFGFVFTERFDEFAALPTSFDATIYTEYVVAEDSPFNIIGE